MFLPCVLWRDGVELLDVINNNYIIAAVSVATPDALVSLLAWQRARPRCDFQMEPLMGSLYQEGTVNRNSRRSNYE